MPKVFVPPVPLPRECNFLVVRKRRYCRLTKKNESDTYCPSHTLDAQVNNKIDDDVSPERKKAKTRQRIPCPIDNRHTIYQDLLHFHLKVCEAGRLKKRIESPSYFALGINEDPVNAHGKPSDVVVKNPPHYSTQNEEGKSNKTVVPQWKLKASEVSVKVESALEALRVGHAYLFESSFNTDIHELELNDGHKEEGEELTTTDTPASKREAKHGRQERSIVAHLDSMCSTAKSLPTVDNISTSSSQASPTANTNNSNVKDIIKCEARTDLSSVGKKDRVVFVEMGAGKGGLSRTAREYFGPTPHHYCLVDRSVFANKLVPLQAGVSRVRIDIRHLDLAKLPALFGVPATESVDDTVGPDCTRYPVGSGSACATTAGASDAVTSAVDVITSGGSVVAGTTAGTSTDGTTTAGTSSASDTSTTTPMSARGHASVSENLSVVQQSERRKDTRMALVSKHLCGPATCYTLRSAMNSLQVGDVMTVALCCHHLLDWDAYCARDVLEAQGIDKDDFDVLSRMTSWAVSGHGRNPCCPPVQSGEAAPAITLESDADREMSLWNGEDWTVEERTKIGLSCKHLLNVARCIVLERAGFRVQLHRFVPNTVTQENCLLTAVRVNANAL